MRWGKTHLLKKPFFFGKAVVTSFAAAAEPGLVVAQLSLPGSAHSAGVHCTVKLLLSPPEEGAGALPTAGAAGRQTVGTTAGHPTAAAAMCSGHLGCGTVCCSAELAAADGGS